MFIPVLVLTALVIGALIGAWRAKRRGGKVLDMLQYAAAHAMALAVLGIFLTIILSRMG